MMQNFNNKQTGRSYIKLACCLLLLTLGMPPVQAVTFTFGMKYNGRATVPQPLPFPSGPATGCSGNTIAVGMELHTVTAKNVGVQMLCGTPSAIGFWTDANRASFIGASGTGVIRALCPSSMAITEVKLDILGADLVCAELRPNFDTGITTVGTAGSANADIITNDAAPIFQASCKGVLFPRTPNRFVQSFTPGFAADGSISTLVPLCNDVVNGVQSGITLTSVLARTVNQDSFQTQRHDDHFDIELFDFGAVPDPDVEIDITAENLPEITQQSDFQGSVFNAPCTPIFLTLNDDAHTQLFRGFHCVVNGQVFRSAAKFLLASIVFEPRAATEDGAALPIIFVDVKSARWNPLTGASGVIATGARFPVVVK
jgi:hypothetical protein